MEILSIETVAAIMGVEPTQITLAERAGTLGWVRYGTGFISTAAAAAAYLEDHRFLDKLAKANAKARAEVFYLDGGFATDREGFEAVQRADRRLAQEQADKGAADKVQSERWAKRYANENAAIAASSGMKKI